MLAIAESDAAVFAMSKVAFAPPADKSKWPWVPKTGKTCTTGSGGGQGAPEPRAPEPRAPEAATATLDFQGSLDLVNNALAHLSYTPGQDWHGHDNVQLRVAKVLPGGRVPLEDSIFIPVQVKSINDPPVIILPVRADGTSALQLREDESLLVTGARNVGYAAVAPFASTATGFELCAVRVSGR